MTKIEIAVVAGLFALLMALSLTGYAAIAQVQRAAASAASAPPVVQPDALAAGETHHASRSRRYRAHRHKPRARRTRDREQRNGSLHTRAGTDAAEALPRRAARFPRTGKS